MNHRAIYRALHADLLADAPELRVRFKPESRLMRLIGALFGVIGFLGGLFRARPIAGYRAARETFMERYTTTIGSSVYFPDRAKFERLPDWDTFAHEGVHMRDSKRWPVWYELSYLFPQCLGALAFVAIAGIWWRPALWFLVFLVALLPWPAPGRVFWERRGYLMSIVCAILERGTLWVQSPAFQEWMADHYTTGDYYWMHRFWPGARARVERWIRADVERAIRICDGIDRTEPYHRAQRRIREAALVPML